MLLAIEEPELFQHPTQKRERSLPYFVTLPAGSISGRRSAYATHTHFVSPEYLDEVRRISSAVGDGGFAGVPPFASDGLPRAGAP